VTYGSAVQPILALMTGALSAMVWAVRMDKYLVFIPSAVMHGFTMGVAFIIAANQLNFILGLPKLKRHPEFVANLYETLMHVGQASGFAIVFFGVSFTGLFMLSKRYGKIPWAVILAILGIIIGAAADASGSNMPIRTIRTQYGDLELSLIRSVDVGALTSDFGVWVDLFKGSVSITAVAVLETLISARIADRMTKTLFDQPREVLSVALSNLASGITGGIPATAALARTALNIKSGATSRASGIVNAVAIILLSTVLFSAFKFLPLPIVGAILVNTAYRMLEIHEIILLFRTDRPMFIVAGVTAIICIIEDPTMGIVYGTFLAMIRMLLGMLHGHASLRVFKGTRAELTWVFDIKDRATVKACRRHFTGELDEEDRKAAADKEAHAHAHSGPSTALGRAAEALARAREAIRMTAEVPVSAEETGVGSNPGGHYLEVAPSELDDRLPRVAVYGVSGYFTYVAAQSHLDRIRALFIDRATALPGVDVLVFSLEQCYMVDPDAMDALGDLIQELARGGKTVFMLGYQAKVRIVLAKVPWFSTVLTFSDYGSLIHHLRDVVRLEDEKAAAGMAATTLQDFLSSRVANATAAARDVAVAAAGHPSVAAASAAHALMTDILSPVKPSPASPAAAGAAAAGASAALTPAKPAGAAAPTPSAAGVALGSPAAPPAPAPAAAGATPFDAQADEWK
jgi:MFS superfamily sulfate permease-like transporter